VKASRLFHFWENGKAAWLISLKQCSFDARSRRRVQAALPIRRRKPAG
jgi:hypothetical protein